MCREGAGFVAACGGELYFCTLSPPTCRAVCEINFTFGEKEDNGMYQALYRKWRPRTFSEVVGQGHITATLQRQVAEGHTAHAYLFTGTRGTGKTTCARILAKAINCENPINGAPCNCCAACRGIDEGTLLDVTELDAASNNGVDHVRALREEAIYTPSVLRRRVYIIDEVHMLSTPAFNALLKIMEEPPEHLVFILATTELHKVPATILSRCQRFSFKRILPRDIQQQLVMIAREEGIDLADDGAEILSRMANGALRDALSLLDQCRAVDGTLDSAAVLDVLGLAGGIQTVQLMRCILQKNTADALALFDKLYRGGKDTAALLGELLDLSRDLTICKAAPEGAAALITGVYDRKTLTDLGRSESMQRFLYLTETLQRTCAALPDSFHPRTEAELCLLKLCDETLSGDLTALAQRIAQLEQQVKLGVTAAPQTAARPQPKPRPAPQPERREEPRYDEPPLPEEPPMPEDPMGRERVFDIPDEVPVRPAPRSAPQPAPPRSTPAPQVQDSAAPGGNSALWAQLLDQYKGRLPVNHRVFLNMASGVLEGDCLAVYCNNDFAKTSLDNNTVLTVLREVTSAAVGQSVRVELRVGKAPQAAPTPQRSAPPPPPQSTPAPVTRPAQTPPWEESAPTSHDRLDELMGPAQKLDHFKIK